MKSYIVFWIFVIGFSFVSFTYMSLKMLIWGIPELREMFRKLKRTRLNNSENNSNSISTSIILFKLYTTVGGYSPTGGDTNIPNTINIGSEYSWYLYFEIPEDAVLNKIVYNTLGIAPAEEFF